MVLMCICVIACCEALGLGGMTTRGFGRVRFLPQEVK